ncbi:DUF6766 family protein [Chitinophaga pinensis]|uniref:Uncharacterized protein n=1 Tax=Chitinophaga pinensis (strain ATCC 43595 / DSM 2588 / LMG 13176 / NBRC 15968 / NCIMB 11800 / UQM 2034) TaxID=485918 RepID=A0A979G850_CHIPD|nr:DUF6766 family protein [Chitinophaga pinensis]ACU62458.1 conserved hypothetical protein [Chitinophaga pinensis DSM 2588]
MKNHDYRYKEVFHLERKGYLWFTLAFFLVSAVLHWYFGWKVFVDEQLSHGQPVETAKYITEMMRDTMENWQSEFLQLIWQVAGLAVLWYCGSSQSKEGDDRREEKIDFIIRRLEPEKAEQMLAAWKEKYPEQ